MLTGKLILSTAALVITAANSIAFKVTNKFSSGHALYVQVTISGENISCPTCRSVRTKLSGGLPASGCYTRINKNWVTARNNRTLFTARTANKVNCTHPFTKTARSL